MTTLISYHTSSGEQGRCDARCYNAKHPTCDCICGGANHGVGREQAIENTRQMAAAMIENYARERGIAVDVLGAKVNEEVYQLPLPLFS